MTEQATPFYRREAVDYQDGPRAQGAVLRLTPPWTRWFFWIVTGLLVLVIGSSFLVRVDRTVSGAAMISENGTSFTALLPLNDAAAVPAGQQVRIQLTAQQTADVHSQLLGVAKHSEHFTSAAARRAGLGPLTGPTVLVSGTLNVRQLKGAKPTSPAGYQARATVVVGSQSIADIFGNGVSRMFSPAGSQ